MKKTLLAVSLICAAFLTGCSRDSILPTQTSSSPTPQGPAFSRDVPVVGATGTPQHSTSAINGTIASGSVNTIQENKILVDPLDKGDLIHVVGTVSFAVHELPILSRDEVRAEITLNGQAFSSLIYGPEDWPIDGNSTQVLDIGLKEQKRVEQTYAIRGYFEPLSLHISYLVTNTEVKVERLWLAPADAAANQ